MIDKPAVQLGYDEPGAKQARESSASPSAPTFEQLWGTIRIVDAEPTWTPRGRLEDSLALLIDGGTPNLCMYDYTNAQWLFFEGSTTRFP